MGKENFGAFIENSFSMLQTYEKKGRYFHTLKSDDNSPVVVHKQTNQFTYVISGEGIVFLNGIEKKITTNEGVFIPAGTTHRFIANTNDLVLFHIHIPDEGRDLDRYVVEGDDYDRYEV